MPNSESPIKIALVGNPNSGKTSIFNLLTGLNQKVGNYPGVTVDIKSGFFRGNDGKKYQLIDVPGIYSLNPKSLDEAVATEILLDKNSKFHPDLILMVADVSNLKRNLFLTTQVIDLKIPTILLMNMVDLLPKNHGYDFNKIGLDFDLPTLPISSTTKTGFSELKGLIQKGGKISEKTFFKSTVFSFQQFIKELNGGKSFFATKDDTSKNDSNLKDIQANDSIDRYNFINKIIKESNTEITGNESFKFSKKIDSILLHPIFGIAIFLLILLGMFQSIFSLAEFPMTWIEDFFALSADFLREKLPNSFLKDLLIDGVVVGISSVLVFIPQITLLFAFIIMMEETGYMARVIFLMDRLMRRFGLNGRSIIPIISGAACAIPAVMSTRTIPNWKERLITIFVTPLITCSARLPVFTLLIALVIPQKMVFGFINQQGLALFSLYLLGFVAAILTALVMKFIVKTNERSYFIMEMPVYRLPSFRSYLLNIFEKIKVFVVDAGKIIIAISIVIFALSSFGPGNRFEEIEKKYQSKVESGELNYDESVKMASSEKLANSYAGIFGKTIQPSIAPLGFDWKIGIALITSFAAREVFVATMATLYSVSEDEGQLIDKMRTEKHEISGKPVYTLASGVSLILFYAFALQCMSTIAVVYRETKHWKWPFIQFVYMFLLAYLSSFAAFELLS